MTAKNRTMDEHAVSTDTSRVLIVDDSPTARKTLEAAVSALGHATTSVDSGAQAIAILQLRQFDLVLLDIVMPDVDGFEVLRYMQKNNNLAHIPVVVISALDQHRKAVFDAIRLGATDVLPKQFDAVLLGARINASIARKRHRDKELDELRRIEKLTRAAQLLERNLVDPRTLELDDMAVRNDALGRLASVFLRMAERVYERERYLTHQLRALHGVGLLLLAGASFGLTIPLSKMAAESAAHPVGLAFWVNLLAALLCLCIAMWRRQRPPLTAEVWRFVILWGITAALAEMMLFWVAAAMPAAIISIILVFEAFIVFVYAALSGKERATPLRFTGLLCGLIGVALTVMAYESTGSGFGTLWPLLALIIPAIYAFEDILIANHMPTSVQLVPALGLASGTSCLYLLPVAWLADDMFELQFRLSALEVAVCLIALASVVGTILIAQLLQRCGAVFGSQAGYTITLAGVAWSIVLLGERLTLTSGIALALLIVGAILVGPRRRENESFAGLATRPGARRFNAPLQPSAANVRPVQTRSRYTPPD